MELQAAPYHRHLADGPAGAAAFWARASDGVRIRVGVFPKEGAKGTVLLFPGRTEYVEKYAHVAQALGDCGYAMLAVDWRGQGLADRLLPDTLIGHVGRFPDYQHDVAAALQVAEAAGLPRPWHLLGHSMGGAIGLRAALQGLAVKSAVFTGPMWGIVITPILRRAAWTLYVTGGVLGFDHRLPPGRPAGNYVATSPFEGNTLTTDRAMWDMMLTQITAKPGLTIGGPSIRWIGEAMRECDWLMRQPARDLPVLCLAGEHESIVRTDAMRDRMARWPGGHFVSIPAARHEVLMETPAIRADCIARIVAHLEAA